MFSLPALSPFSSRSSLHMRVLFAFSSIFSEPHSPFGTLNTIKLQYPKCEKESSDRNEIKYKPLELSLL